jgi:hypothetical protein
VAQQTKGRFRRFLSTTPGLIVIIVVALLVVFATYAYVSVVIAIPALLLFGLALPIWAGVKRPRFLALLGLVIVVAVAPITTIVFTQEIMSPVGLANSASGYPFSSGAPIMQNASVHPFNGGGSTNFTWKVTVYPANVPKGNTTPVWLNLYISTCPGATGNNSPYCSAPYPLVILNYTNSSGGHTLPNQTTPYQVSFHYQIASNGVWDWQMGLFTKNTTTGRPFFQLLVGDPTYNGIEGPVIGGFGVIYAELILTVYFQDILFLGAPFYFVLLIYMLFKNREKRRKEAMQRAPGPVPPDGLPANEASPAKAAPLPSSQNPTGSSAVGPGTTTGAQELNCPKCNAVVYAGEQTCWKCGATLPAAPAPSGTSR